MMPRLRIIALLLMSATLVPGRVLASTISPKHQSDHWNWVGTLSVGPAWQSGGRTQTFYLAPNIEKTYADNTGTSCFATAEVFIGLHTRLSQTLTGQLGLAGAASSDAAFAGAIWDDADPEFDNYTYRYKIRHGHLAVKAKFLADRGFWLIPWISGSLGVGFNYAHSFQNTPRLLATPPNANFASKTKTALTYTVGAGIQTALSTHWQVGASYEFADWGKTALGRAEGQTQNTGLSLNHLYAHGVLSTLTYIA